MDGPLNILSPSAQGDMPSPLSGMITAGMGAISGNPIAIASGVLGIGMSILGGSQATEAAKHKAEAQRQIAGFEMQQDEVRRKAMELSAHRQQIEVLRNAQRARSLALNNATSQGAQLGSGLQGGFGQIAGAANWNNTGIQQNLSFGEQMFNLNRSISQQKMNIGDFESSAATAAGISKIGSSLTSSFGPIKNVSETLAKGTSGSESNINAGGWAGLW